MAIYFVFYYSNPVDLAFAKEKCRTADDKSTF